MKRNSSRRSFARRFGTGALAAVLALGIGAAAPAPARAGQEESIPEGFKVADLSLAAGETVLLYMGGAQRVSVGDPSIADVRPRDGEWLLEIKGTREGATTLLVWIDGGGVAYRLTVKACGG